MVTPSPRASRSATSSEGVDLPRSYLEVGDVDAGLLGEGGVGVSLFGTVAGEVGAEVFHS